MYKVTVPTLITNGHFNKEKTLQELRRCKVQRVALAMDRELEYAFSSPQNLALLQELIAYYRQNGLETLVWLGETLGYDRGLVPEGSKKKYKPCICMGKEPFNPFARWMCVLQMLCASG